MVWFGLMKNTSEIVPTGKTLIRPFLKRDRKNGVFFWGKMPSHLGNGGDKSGGLGISKVFNLSYDLQTVWTQGFYWRSESNCLRQLTPLDSGLTLQCGWFYPYVGCTPPRTENSPKSNRLWSCQQHQRTYTFLARWAILASFDNSMRPLSRNETILYA